MSSKSNNDFAESEVNEHNRSFGDIDTGPAAPMETGTVARGRTLMQIIPGTTRIAGFTKDGNPVSRPKYEELGEGATFMAPAAEIKRLRDLGYLHDPAKVMSDAEAAGLDKNGAPVDGNGGVGFVRAG
jgi:hypothetical protein